MIESHDSTLTIAPLYSTVTLEAIDIHTYMNFIMPWQFIEQDVEVE